MLKIIPPQTRRYRVKRKRRALASIKPNKRFLVFPYICKAIAISLFIGIVPLLVVILPLMLIAIAVVTVADKINQLGGCFDD